MTQPSASPHSASPYDIYFQSALDRLKQEARYRVFTKIERQTTLYPQALWHHADGPRPITLWCSNDYLGQGHHPEVIEAVREAALGGLSFGAPTEAEIVIAEEIAKIVPSAE